jgi:hypothetical protein
LAAIPVKMRVGNRVGRPFAWAVAWVAESDIADSAGRRPA